MRTEQINGGSLQRDDGTCLPSSSAMVICDMTSDQSGRTTSLNVKERQGEVERMVIVMGAVRKMEKHIEYHCSGKADSPYKNRSK